MTLVFARYAICHIGYGCLLLTWDDVVGLGVGLTLVVVDVEGDAGVGGLV